MRFSCLVMLFFLFCSAKAQTSELPVMFFATYGNMSGKDCIDNDFSQTIFFTVPESFKEKFYLRIFDPDCGGMYDISNGHWETNTIFEVFGGEGCISEFDARQFDPHGNYKSGKRLARELFAKESEVDGKWITFGPYEITQGEKLKDYPGYVFFKTIVEGRTGNDTNLYSLSLSGAKDKNIPIKNAVFFEYEKTFLNGVRIDVTRVDEANLSTNSISLPVNLVPIPSVREIDIIVEPIDY